MLVVRAEFRGGRDDGKLFDTGRLGGDGSHEDGRGIGGSTAGDADADAGQWEAALGEIAVAGG